MTRGRLRVMLGAAPGVGKTYAMLEEGRRLAAAGKDVVLAVVETHGRAATSALVEGLELIPRQAVEHRGVVLQEMDLDAVLARKPELALVDELAHTNAPGSPHDKRWQDVEAILAAGIDVISTVNIQHIESLNDVVRQITGVAQRETIPDAVLRGADQIELVDLAPQSLRDRLSEGLVYPAGRVDAALSNYFRLGNLTALRELALLWLADEVDSALRRYRAEKGIDSAWNARERVVVALTGGREGETLLRRGARIASRSSGGELFAVHVTTSDGLAESDPGILEAQKKLAETLGGTYHQVVGEQIPRALVEFARSVDATQLVIGVSRRGVLARLFGGPGTAATVIRDSGDIDVHVVTHSEAGSRALPTLGGALSVRRRVAGFLLALGGLPLLTWVLSLFRSDESLASDVLAFQLFIVIVALVGGIWLMWWLGFNLSVAVVVGFIALAGVAAETGVVMLIYLNQALADIKVRREREGRALTRSDLYDAIMEGAVERVRPKMMTVVAIMAGLLPIMWSTGTGSEIMQRIAVPMIGGMVSSTLLTLIVIPAIYGLVKERRLKSDAKVKLSAQSESVAS